MIINQMLVVVTSLKGNILVLLLATIITFSFGCTQRQKESINPVDKGFIKSRVFQDHLNNYEDKASMIYSEKRFFNLINEGAFLNCEHYDFYIVYVYKESLDSVFNIYLLKSNDEIVLSSKKTFGQTFPFCFIKEGKSEPKESFNMEVSSKVVFREQTADIKHAIDKSLKEIKDRMPQYDVPSRTIYYYDGRDYYGISDNKVSSETMGKLDSLLRTSNLFK